MTQDLNDSSHQTRARRWGWLKPAFVVVGLLSIVPGFYLEERIRGEWAWEVYEADALKRGVKLKFSDYIPPEVPDAENFASIPIIDAVFRASDAGQATPDPFELPGKKDKWPRVSNITKQEHIDLVAWQKYFVEREMLPKAGDNAAADILLALEKFNAPLQELREAGRRPRCRFPVHWEKGYAAALPHFGVLQSAVRLHGLRLASHLALGDSAAAYEDFRDGLRVTTAIREEPTLIAGLVRISMASMMLNGVWDGIEGKKWAAADLQKIQADLSKLDWLEDYVFSMSNERGSENDMFDLVIHDRKNLQGISGRDPDSDRGLRFYPVGRLYQSKVRANRYIDELLRRVEPERRRFFGDRPTPSSPEDLTSIPAKIWHLLFAIMAPVMGNVANKFVQVASMTDHAILACALERYRLARGAYPEKLDELVPDFIEKVPAEIVNGEPYRYRPSGDGRFLLYSVGMDLHDDGGVFDPKIKAGKQKDWIWTGSLPQ
jgi:hypothetical protein